MFGEKQRHLLQPQKGAHAHPFIVSVPAVVSVVLFDQNLDQKIDLGWPGSSPGLGQGQALGKIAPIFPRASQDVKKWRPRDFFGILELESCPGF